MPINYPQIPFRPADPSGAYAKGYGLGVHSGQAQAQIAMQRAALAQKAHQDAIEVVVKQQQFEREATLAGQRLEVEKAYKAQQNSIAQQELEVKQQEMQKKMEQAANQQMQMERFRAAIANNEDPARATLLNAGGLPNMGGIMGAALRAMEDRSKPKDAQLRSATVGETKFPYLQTPGGSIHMLKDPKKASLNAAQWIAAANTVANWDKSMFGGDENKLNEFRKATLAKAEEALRGGATNAPAAALEILPWTTDKKKLIEGKVYQHPKRGPVRYDGGGNFSPYTPSQSALESPEDMEFADAADLEDEELEAEET